MGWSGVRVPAGVRNFSSHHRVQTGSGAHPASYTMDTRGFFPGGGGVKLPLREADHSPQSSAEVRMRGIIAPLPNTPSRSCAQLNHRGNFTFFYALKWKQNKFSNQAFLLKLTLPISSVVSSFNAILIPLFTVIHIFQWRVIKQAVRSEHSVTLSPLPQEFARPSRWCCKLKKNINMG
jgi:hypothetical protein